MRLAKSFLVSHRDVAMIFLVAAIFILAVVYSVFSASTLSGTQLGVGTSTPGAALSVRGGLLVAGGDAQILGGPLNVGFIIATSTTASSLVGNLGVGSSSPGAALGVRGEGLFDGRLTADFLTATSTTATSSIAYGLTVITSGGTFGIGTTTPGLAQEVGIFGDVYQSSGGTTTITSFSTSATQGGCIELEAPDGSYLRLYAGRGRAATTSSGAVGLGLVFEAGRCQ